MYIQIEKRSLTPAPIAVVIIIAVIILFSVTIRCLSANRYRTKPPPPTENVFYSRNSVSALNGPNGTSNAYNLTMSQTTHINQTVNGTQIYANVTAINNNHTNVQNMGSFLQTAEQPSYDPYRERPATPPPAYVR
ncbi:CIC11C00000003631 [Sungouiella intermedia]|uniref:CIC11C00000003631 n=1 Tax=Sungouiella intermedia TaxID=45354 RepID=A0A1L0BVV7_9ASCO|nr:CIC11C00000003631 [[Candida] intermedia]